MAMSEKSVALLDYLKSIGDANVTHTDAAAAMGIDPKSVTGTFTSLQKKGLGERVPADVELEDGTTKAVKFLKLTAEGKAFDPSED